MSAGAGDYRRIAGAAVALGAVPLLVTGSSSLERTLAGLVVFALLAVALNLAFGHTDQLFLFVGGLAGVGAYTTALSARALGVSAWLTLPLAALVAGALAGLVSWVAARRRFTAVLVAVLTLNLQLAATELFVGARGLTGGSTGFPFEGLGLEAAGDALGVSGTIVLYYLLIGLLVAALVGYVRLVASRHGLAFAAIRADETAARAVGIDVVRYRTAAGALIGVTGVGYVGLEAYVSPGLFGFLRVDVVVLIALVIGGLRSTLGPVVGAVVVVGLEELLRLLVTGSDSVAFGALLIVAFLYFRRGIVPAVDDALARRRGGGGDDGDGDGDGDGDAGGRPTRGTPRGRGRPRAAPPRSPRRRPGRSPGGTPGRPAPGPPRRAVRPGGRRCPGSPARRRRTAGG
jgi:branched-chain amino acid transport system permease protein